MSNDNKNTTISNNYKDTLNLPRTDFPIRSNARTEDVLLLERWNDQDLYTKTYYHNKGKKKFILIDGPPYANGPIHLGHAYNKILKDIVCKSQRMFGNHVPVNPGWDCHGLPIELKVTQAHPNLSRQDLKKACRIYADEWISSQMKDFKKLGVMQDWNQPYKTMDFTYQADTLRAFARLVDQGYIERKNRTVPWCYSCKTVLATAEIEYKERKDPSIYVLFTLTTKSATQLFPDIIDRKISFVAWTTTPWTLTLNRSILLKNDTSYTLLDVNDTYIIVGTVLADSLCALLAVPKKVIAHFSTSSLKSGQLHVHNPILQEKIVPVILDNSVLLQEGTACVHNAPGAGPEDYDVGVRNNLEVYSPINADGTMTADIQPEELIEKKIDEVQIWVFKKLVECNTLLHKTSLRHPYPHCWRCHNGLIFRATKQWFCNLIHDNLKQKTLDTIDSITMLPQASHNRFKATIEGRLEWCLSRQRTWGNPITALLCIECDHAFISADFITKIAQEIEKEGIEYWDRISLQEVMPTHLTCEKCGGNSFKKEEDILDVWFDSGIGHYAVLKKYPELAFPADMFLEGKDQHRGYFQSSLLTSMAINHVSCMKTIVTHGFTVDKTGRKMSKSLGNVISPQEIINEIGTDCLRLWTASIDCSSEAVVSETLLKNVQEVLRKIRNTCRFLLSNLYDFDYQQDILLNNNHTLCDLHVIDIYALSTLMMLNDTVQAQYKKYDFTGVFHTLADYCSVDLSSFYLDIIKDRLYVEKANGLKRRSAQTACWYILDTLTRLIAPILSFTAEHISDYYQVNKTESIHLQDFTTLENIRNEYNLMFSKNNTMSVFLDEKVWKIIKEIRSALLKAIELKREKQIIKHSLEAHVLVFFDFEQDQKKLFDTFLNALQSTQETVTDFFKELLIVSQFVRIQSKDSLEKSTLDGLYVHVTNAKGHKCQRCWQWHENLKDMLCERCLNILDK